MAGSETAVANIQDLNSVVYGGARLVISTFLISAGEVFFTEFEPALGLTDGNLDLHRKVFEEERHRHRSSQGFRETPDTHDVYAHRRRSEDFSGVRRVA